jgi:hypothetical protein
MNKAFVREPDQTADYCPRCGSQGEVAPRKAVEAHVPPERLQQISEVACFCPSPGCDVVYFDSLERVLDTAAVGQPVYPKDPAAPICACFGLTCDEIDQDIAEGVVTRTRAALEKAKSPAARCSELSPSGRSCIADIQRYYMKNRQT